MARDLRDSGVEHDDPFRNQNVLGRGEGTPNLLKLKILSFALAPSLCHTGSMPKRLSRDINEAAFQMVRRSTGTETPPKPSEISRVMSAMGRKGGKIGGKRRLETMTPEERSQVAARAAQTRWAKHKAK
jgi:hypothetical protein